MHCTKGLLVGVVPPSQGDTDSDLLLRGVVRVENVENPAQYAHAALNKCERRHVERTYGIIGWTDADEFLEKLAEKSGRLLKGGERDLDGVAKMFLNDFLRGKVPWFVKPPGWMETPLKRSSEEKGMGANADQMEEASTRRDVKELNQQAALNARKRKRRDEGEADHVNPAEAEGAQTDMDAEAGINLAESRNEWDASDDNTSHDEAHVGDSSDGSTPEPEEAIDSEGGAKLR